MPSARSISFLILYRSWGISTNLVIVPLGILAVVKLVPAEILAELREEAARRLAARPRSWAGAAVVVVLWLVLLAVTVRWLVSLFPVSS